ncbi:MAG: hypothetical protein HC933_20730 [Pleurocapsa sp. SU_196_0]|nr:hypothetical protein [Pleurocapsa sp. SU_196_0]
MKRKPRAAPYIRRARQRFLEGTWHRTPADAVRAGFRSLEDWADILNEERGRERTLARGDPIRPSHPIREERRL